MFLKNFFKNMKKVGFVFEQLMLSSGPNGLPGLAVLYGQQNTCFEKFKITFLKTLFSKTFLQI